MSPLGVSGSKGSANWPRAGVGFRSLTEQIDITASLAELVVNALGSIAQFERELARERTNASLEAASDGELGDQRPVIMPDIL